MLLATHLNGAELAGELTEVPTRSDLQLVFSATIDREAFEREFTISPEPISMTITYANQSSRARVMLELAPETDYTITLGAGVIGERARRLPAPLIATFRTVAGGSGTTGPCTSADADCLRSLSFGQDAFVNYFASYPLDAKADIESAIVVVHGANRDADNYFSYLTESLAEADLSNRVALFAPYFKQDDATTGGELGWSGNGWRNGSPSSGAAAISAFGVIDSIVTSLGNKANFPNLTKIVITGHSSGAFFTQLYGAANQLDGTLPGITFEYVAANSQYYYYPDGRRINEADGTLFTPTDCAGYEIYPYGYQVVVPYLSSVDKLTFDERFLSRSITYVLGNGNGPDPTLNTTDCFVTLLGSTRFNRGQNLFTYLQTAYGDRFKHRRTVVEGIGHDGEAIYDSPEFLELLTELLK